MRDTHASEKPAKERFQIQGRRSGSQSDDKTKGVGSRKALVTICAVCVVVAIGSLGLAGYSLVTTNSRLKTLDSETEPVVVATVDMSSGTTITADDVSVTDVPDALVTTGAFTSVDEVIGQTTASAVAANSIVSSVDVQSTSTDSLSALEHSIDSDHVAVMLTFSGSNGLSPLLNVGDVVNVASSSGSGVVASKAKVLALDGSFASHSGTYSTVTLEVTTDEAPSVTALGSSAVLIALPVSDGE